ncbi:MAG TPA: hypothetical protein VFN61_08250 [Acidimicrobiales bacterium]|nr:hypothetical protein [Acidimicrobiales bacterium]
MTALPAPRSVGLDALEALRREIGDPLGSAHWALATIGNGASWALSLGARR